MKIFKSLINVIGILLSILGIWGLTYSYSKYSKESIPSGDAGATDDGFVFTFKNNPELNRKMDKYEIASKKYTLRQQYLSQMRDSGIILILGIIILVFGAGKNIE